MPTYILGLSAFYHDSAACLLRDGEIVAAAQEERFTRRKHDHRFPANAVEYCLREAAIAINEVDHVSFYDKPWLKFERLLETYLVFAPAGLRSFMISMPLWLKEKLWMGETIKHELGYEGKLYYPEHHQSHAASAFFSSPFEEAAILTIDGVGEWATASWGTARANKLDLTHELRFPHSLGLLYSAFTYYTGFRVNSGEYKLMGLAPYGKPRYADLITKHLLDLKEDGSFRMDMKYFNYCQGLTMTSSAFHDLFGGPPRKPEAKITQREMDLAASIQKVTEKIMLRMVRHIRYATGQTNLCLAGGVALNCVANGKIMKEEFFDRIWIQPAAGDAGGALGAALFAWYHALGNERSVSAASQDKQKGAYLGPSYGTADIELRLHELDAPYHHIGDDEERNNEVARCLARGDVVGWFQGRMEFGPRALGARSILGDARNAEMQRTMNLKIKYRESFRPFAPSVLAEDAANYFELNGPSPYMLLVADVCKDRRKSLSEDEKKLEGMDLLNVPRSDIPAVTHVDYSARVQTVDGQTNRAYYELLKAFKAATGSSVLINTSFNVRGEPIVNTPEDAYVCFMRTEMDVLVLENIVLYKSEQPQMKSWTAQESTFVLD